MKLCFGYLFGFVQVAFPVSHIQNLGNFISVEDDVMSVLKFYYKNFIFSGSSASDFHPKVIL